MKDGILDQMNLLKNEILIKIARNSGIILFGNSAASVLGIISFTIMANVIGPESLAWLVLAQTYSLIINDIFNIQTWESMVKFGSDDSENGGIANVIKTNSVLDVGSAVVAFIFALLLAKPVVHVLGWDESLISVISLYSLSILFNITSLTIGIPRLFDKFKSIAKIQVVSAVLKLLCILYAMYSAKTFLFYIYVYLFFDILTNVMLIVFSIVLLRNELGSKWWAQKMEINKEQIRFIWWSNLRTIIRIPVRHLDMIIISSVMSVKTVGIYKVYKEIAGLINRIGEPVNQAIFPEFTKLLAGKDAEKTAGIAKKSILLLSVVSVVVTMVLLVTSNLLVGQFFGIEYLPQISVLHIMLVLYGISFLTLPVNSLFIASGFVKYSFLIVLFTNSVYLVTAYSGGMTLGIYGIVLAIAVQLVFNKGLKIYFLNKYSGDWGNVAR